MKRTMLLIVIAALAITALLGAAPALATPGTASTYKLENLLKREQITLANQEERLATSNEVIATVEEWIAHLAARGEDISLLEAALADYKGVNAKAAGHYDTAKSTLDTHAGFDSSGGVIDAHAALQTLVTAGKAERQFHLIITPAAIEFREAVVSYIKAGQSGDR